VAPALAGFGVGLRVLHVITGLGIGGAETMLARLVEATPAIAHVVAPLTEALGLAPRIAEAGARVVPLGIRSPATLPGGLLRLARLIRAVRPDVIQSWLYHADLAATLVQLPVRRPAPLVWSIRCADLDLGRYAPTTRWVVRALARLSPLPAAVVSNSEAGLAWHLRLGYRPRRAVVIPNGYDTDRFRPRPEAGAALRRMLGWPDEAVIVGMVARVDPAKDHAGFLEAIGRGPPALRAVLIGHGTESLPIPRALAGRIAALGVREDVAALTAGFDIACLASFTEGFPNVVAEAMACGVPCVATTVGDAAAILDGTGILVPPGDPSALAAALARLAAMPAPDRRALGAAGRARVLEAYSIAAAAERYVALWHDAAATLPHPARTFAARSRAGM
jgi:glycosyltransferase involved in cell wall biosynthesis